MGEETAGVERSFDVLLEHDVDGDGADRDLCLSGGLRVPRPHHGSNVSACVGRLAAVRAAGEAVDAFLGVGGVGAEAEAAPVDSDIDDFAGVRVGEGSDDEVGSGGGVAGLDLEVQGRFGSDHDAGDEPWRALLRLFLQ